MGATSGASPPLVPGQIVAGGELTDGVYSGADQLHEHEQVLFISKACIV